MDNPWVRVEQAATRKLIIITEPSGQSSIRTITCSVEDAMEIAEQLLQVITNLVWEDIQDESKSGESA